MTNQEQSECICKDFWAWRTVALKARRVGENHGLGLDLRTVNLMITGALLSSKVETVVL